MRKRPARDDLFAIFPDLPRRPHRTAAEPKEQVDPVQRQVKQTQGRATENIRRQQAATERVRAAIAGRRFRN